MIEHKNEPVGKLQDGTQLYQAYQWDGAWRLWRALSAWTGQTGYTIGVTKDGRTFQRGRMYGNESRCKWTPVTVA